MAIKLKIAIALTIILALMTAFVGCGRPPAEVSKVPGVVVNVIDVGQGDAILIRTSSQTTLIDTGDVPAREKLISYISGLGISVIDTLIITHPHSDHIGGASAVLSSFKVERAYDSGQTTTSHLYRKYLAQIQESNIPFRALAAGEQLDIGGGAVLKIFAPSQPLISGTDSDLNNNSVVAKLVYGNFSMLLPGDSEQEAEERIVSQYAGDLHSLVLKSGHHGSHTSSKLPFLQAVNPEAVVISVGANNEYHHPHPSTLKRYNSLGINIYRTDTDGTVTITSDGKTYNITKER